MNVEVLSILKEAYNKKVKIGVNEGSLTIKSATTIDADLLQKIKDNKIHIVEFIEGRQVKNRKSTLSKVTPYDRDSIKQIPLSFSQERLWFLDQLQGSTEYHIPSVLRLEGALDISILEQTLREIVSRHEVLRSMLLSEDGIGYQEIISAESWSLDQLEIGNASMLESTLQDYLMRPFDLSKDYKLRSCLYGLGNNQYVLAIVFHHIASDGWSEGILTNEFMELYSALQSGRPAVLPGLSLQYADYAIWQRKCLEGEVLDNQLSYWETKLSGVSTLSLPTDYVRPSVQSNAGASVSLELERELSNSLSSICQKEGVTLFMLLLSAFKILLSRYSGQDDICVGTPIANRTQSELEGMIGFFVNTLALRSDLSGDPSFKELLSRVKQTTLEGYDHQLTPFEKVVDRVITTRDMSMTPLFQVLFVLQNASNISGENRETLEGVTLSGYEFDTVTSKFDLVLNASESGDHISFNILYCTALFDKATIDRMLVHYQELLVSIVSNITQPISNLSILTTKEEYQLLYEFNDTNVTYPKDKTLIDLFTEQVKQTPDAIAVVYEDEKINYKELDQRSNQLAHYLLSINDISGGSQIGVVLDRSDSIIVSFLAILKIGATYVPIDPNHPEERKEYIKKDSNCSVIVDDLLLEIFKKDRSKYSNDLPEIVVGPADLAYIIYTSGSTGKPKGVMIEHRSIVNTILSQISAFSITNKDTCLQFASISFDASIWEICISLLSGSRLCIIKEEAKSDIVSFRNFIANNAITFATLPPAFLQLLSVEDIKSITTLVTAGESIPLELAKTFSQHYNYVNAYGPTEASICSTTFQGDMKNIVSIGKPIDNTQVYVMNEEHNLLPVGVVGELCIGGAGVARGYLNLEQLTQEKFINNPFIEGGRIYKTGDLARWLPDGNLEYLGRKDDQVKIRGYRIELGEIENVLSALSGVRQCCVLAKEDVNNTKRLVGYVVMEGVLDKEVLQEQLKLHLPEYMIPMIWISLEKMPITSNGKLDKKSLPDPENSELSTSKYIAPRNETENQLVTIWKGLLGIENIGIYDDFFELGGHSLLVVQLISRLQALDFHIKVKDIFAGPTIASISDKLSSTSLVYSIPPNGIKNTSDRIIPSMVPLLVDFNQNDLDKIVTMVPGGVSNIEDIYPLSPLQAGIHFHNLMSNPAQGDLYIVPTLLSFSDSAKRVAFIEALQFVVNRHDVLRTFFLSDGLPNAVQVVLREAKLALDDLDLEESKAILPQLELLIASGSHWMDISKAPLLELKSADDPINGCYYLIIYQHHLIMDHVGLEVITEEMMLYLSGEGTNLPTPVLYRDFIGHTLHAQSIDDGEFYFKSLFDGIEEPTYPFNLSNVLGDGTGIEESTSMLSQDVSASLRNTCIKLSMSPAVLFHAAFGLVIARCSNKEYAVFGSLFSGRLQGSIGAADSLGLFINTLPVALKLKGSVKEYLQEVKVRLEELLSYEQTPLSDIHHWSNISNEMALFSALLNYRHSLLSSSEENNARDIDLGITLIGSHERTNYPFNLSIDDFGVDFGLKVLVDKSLSADRILAYMEQALIQLIEGATSEEEVNIDALNILQREEKHQLLDVFNNTQISYPLNKSLIHLFEEQVERTPDAIAIVYREKELSYSALSKCSNQLAHYLLSSIKSNVDNYIGVTLDRSDWSIISFLAILKTGSAYVPIDPNYPEERKKYIKKDSNCSIIIDTLFLDSFKEDISKYPDSLPEIVLKADDLAYVIYTSGTTGKPKGVMVEHSSVINLCFNIINTFDINQFTICSQLISVSFDASVSEIYPSLISGSSLHIIDDEIKNGATLVDYIKSNAINHLTIPSDLFGQLGWEELPALKSVHIGGGVSSYNTLKEWSNTQLLVNGYGPTECTVCATMHDFKDGDLNTNIGKPLNNTNIYILDTSNILLPIGVIGELYIGGVQVARGYLNQDELTQEKFIANPFNEGERIYKTGDLARWLPDGNIEFIGRKDNQVKIRGYRIELGEIENVLSSLPGVTQCCVLAKEDAGGSKCLVGYVVLEGALDKGRLQEQLKLSLPEYMVPMLWIGLEKFPLTSNGKLDKNALPDPDSLDLSSKDYVAPGNETETQLAEIWQNLLGLEQVGIHDNFFELGGHSLLATRLVSVIRKDLMIEVSIREVFEHTTISELGIHILKQSAGVLLPGIVVEERPARIPLSFSQERLWFLDALQGSTEYHIPIVLSLEGALEVSILEQTLQEIVSRHEVLRSMLLSEDGIGFQEIISAESWLLDQAIVSDELLIENNISDYVNKPFDLSKDYKLRACLYTLENEKYVLACVFHHIASDGWSGGILTNEFMELYNAFKSNKTPDLPELSLQYADYAIWQRKYLEGEVLENQLSYWEEKLKGVSTLSLPTDYVRPVVQSNEGANVSLELGKDLRDSLSSICQEEGVTLFMLMLSAFKILLSRYSGQDDICVGTPIANRTQSELEGMIGFFVNMLALRSDLSGDPSFKELLSRVKQTTLKGYDHQLTPFEKVVDRVITSRDMSITPLFQVLFSLQNSEESKDAALEGVTLSSYDTQVESSQFDLTLNVSESNNGISLGINYCTALFDKATIDRMLLHYQELLVSIAGNITQPISSLSLLTSQEANQLLYEFNDTDVAYPLDKTIVDLFTEQVKKTPNAIAVVYGNEELSYKELDEKSTHLALYLQKHYDLSSNDIVGLMLDRSTWSIISILGILKLGACYLPIDKEYPENRKFFVVNDAHIKLLIIESESLFDVIEYAVPVFSIDVEFESVLNQVSSFPALKTNGVQSSDLAYVIYTSGSTGNPKGVMIEHGSLVNYLLYGISHYGEGDTSQSFPLFSSLSFDLTQTSIYLTLLTGGQLHIYKDNDVSSVLKSIALNDAVTSIKLTPAHLSFFRDLGHSQIKRFIIGGEQLTHWDLSNLGELDPSVKLFNEYGPTESTIGCTVLDVTNYQSLDRIDIGRPIANTTIYIVNERLELLPIGVIGELCVGGVQVARGYLNRDDLTREKFIENPFKEGERIYKTGDLARWLPDGNIEYLGRKDDQVKIRGYRIELGEIENILSSLDGVTQCCVLAKEDAIGSKRLVGYVVPEGDFDKEVLQNQLKLSLPEYMIPQLWVTLDAMPLTGNGKLDKKSLPDPDNSDLSSKEYVAPRSETERQLAEIWQNLLGIEQVGIHDDFFELGGHSLLATRLVSMIRKELSKEIEIADIFAYTTISELGTHISAQSEGVLLPSIVVENRPVRIPLSFSQERLWFLDQLQGSTEYHIPIVLGLEGALEVSILEQTLQEIVARHEVLRSMLLSEDGIGYQEIISAEDWSLDQAIVSDDLSLENNIADYVNKPFDLSKDFKLRACFYTLGNEKYVLACVFHHIASDGWSGGILTHEFMELYNAFQSNKTPDLPELSLQYADYAIWQRKYLEGEVLENQLSYWEEKLSGVSTLSLPTDYVRPSVQSNEGASVSLELGKELRDSLKSICQQEGVTLFMLLLSAFKVLLSRYSGQDDICVGTPIANRTQSELEGMIGFFVNTLALRSDLSDNPSFRDLLSRVKKTTLEGYDHQLTPFEKVVDRVVTTRDMSVTPLFQVMFDFQNIESNSGEVVEQEAAIKGVTLSNYALDMVTAQFDLTFSVSESNHGISLGINYCTALFDKATIDRMLLHYQELLVSIASNITQSVSSLAMLTKEESHQLLNVFNNTDVAYPLDKTVVDLFEEQVKRAPDAIAVVYEQEELTYKELDERSNQLGHYLREQGVQPDDLVAICLERSLEMLVGILGILKSGGAYVPIKPDYPTTRISYIVRDIGCSLLLTDSSAKDVLNPLLLDVTTIVLEGSSAVYNNYSVGSLDLSYSPNSLSYVIYTSGSTGVPKGAMIDHCGLLNHLLVMVDELDIDSNSVVAFTAPFTFDISVWQLLSGLLCGARIAIYNEHMILDTYDFQEALSTYQVTHLQLVPSYLLSLLETGSRKGLEDLHYFLITGEAATGSLLRSWFSLYPAIPVVNAYGPAEASDDVSLHIMRESPKSVVVPVGKPVANMSLYVVDVFDNLCPIGIVGELWVSGVGVGRGYLNQPELTSEKFIKNPFKEGERVYKTGDLARWLPDGIIEYIGRKDDQVKIRGYRIELGEIENILSSLAGVTQCCVLAKEDTNGSKRLVGYIVFEDDFDKEVLQNQLKLSLPEYMVPQLWVTLEEMPLTSNGKLDKKSLPDPNSSELSSKEYVAPRNETEVQLAVIWQNLLGVERVGIHDNFFELGGHSLLATRLVSMIRKELHIEVSIREVFEHTTISELGTHISAQSEGVLLPTIVVENRPVRIPLSFSQERLWFLDALQGSTEYHIPIVLSLEGALEVSILEQTLQEIVARHEVLRSMLLSEDGIGYQEIISAEDWSLDQAIVSDDLSLENNIADYVNKPFDLSKDFKLRACLYTLGNDKYVLACVFHHIASDGWSEGILTNEFMELYSAFQSNKTPDLPELSLQYADYAIWQRKYLEGEVLENQLSYWEAKLRGVTTLSLPTDYIRPSVQSNEGANVSLELDHNLRNSLNSICKEEGVTLFMLLLSAFKVLLSRYSGQDDICVGTPIANRTQSELEGMIGFFVNMLALRTDLSGDLSFKDVLSKVKQTTLEGYDHQLTPFEKVVDRVITTRDMNVTPLFQVLFSLQNEGDNFEEKDRGLNDITISGYELDTVTSKFDLAFSVLENNNGISLGINYCTALFDKATIDRMLLHYQELLVSVANNISQPISSLAMLTKEESHQLLDVFNNTDVAYPLDKTLVDLFSEQVKRTPNTVAVVHEEEELTYKKLDQRSNQLAHYLLSNKNISADTLIGVVLDRSEWLIISFLAILKTGAAYVPIDPNFPEERITYIKEDSNCSIIVDTLLLETFKKDSSTYSDDLPKIHTSPDNLAYVIYTSGSTGKPKGVMIEHRNLVHLCFWHQSVYAVTSQSRGTLFSGVGFDASVWEIYPYLLSGASLYPISEKFHYDLDKFSNFLIEHAITHTYMPTLLCESFIDKEISLPNIIVLTGGDVLHLNKPSDITIYNNYGPTETTVVATNYKVLNTSTPMVKIPIGKPIDNTQVYIMNEGENLLPIGVVGELCIGGLGVARGYLNQEELTNDKFIVNPFKEGERIYKTGDLARWLPDGNIEYIGRKDDQVKIRGYRIELGEIENVLSSLAGVTQCCVLAKEDTHGTKRLVGYVVPEGDFDKEVLQNQLKLSLPEYMVPQLWVTLEVMPLTSNGKLDKKSLPNPDSSDLSSKEYVAPRNETEAQLAEIWQEILGINKVGIHDNFFELGGHSLLATRLVSMIRRELSIEISIRDVFEYTTISELGTQISKQSEGVLLPGIVAEERPARIPLSFSQERLWFLDALQGSTEYHIPIVLSLEGALDVSILEQTLYEIISRHEVLRSMLLSENGIGYQKIISAEDWSLDKVIVSNELLLENNIAGYLNKPFNLSKDYKLRACLYTLGNEKYVLACVFHHIASDGWSGGILTNEFMELYSALQSGRPAVLPELSLQYADYAIWQRKYLEGAVLESQLSYWKSKLTGISSLSLPTDYVRPSAQSNAGAGISLELDQKLATSLSTICQEEGVTLFMLLLSVFKILLSRYSGQDDICVGTPIANRTQSDLEGMIGFFVNTLALRSDLSGDPSFKDLLTMVKQTTLEGYDNQLTPFEKVVDRVITTRNTNTTPLFQVMFDFQNMESNFEGALEQGVGIQGVALSNYAFDIVTAQFDIILSVSESRSGISLGINYCTALFDKATIDRMLLHYQELLVSIADNI
ncbi:non-ribosomal peptide synthetase, partial [Flavobacterium aquicola]